MSCEARDWLRRGNALCAPEPMKVLPIQPPCVALFACARSASDVVFEVAACRCVPQLFLVIFGACPRKMAH
jgi:hypothetical protein